MNIIIGRRSLLSQSKKFDEKKFLKLDKKDISDINLIKKLRDKKLNIIINLFYPSSKLNNDINIPEFVDQSFYLIFNFLEKVNNQNINKIIYTSSSAVYGIPRFTETFEKRKIYALAKLNCEVLLDHFCLKHKINLNIVRLFNLYGDEDTFSIISKIKKSIKNKESIKIFNYGRNVRDFIYVDDVANIYIKLLKSKKYPKYLDLGTGSGIEIKSLIDSLNHKKAIFLKSNSKEITLSIADKLQTNKYFKKYRFYKLKDYFEKNRINFNENKLIQIDSLNKNYSINNRKRFVIYGAGNAGNQVFKILSKNPDNEIIFYVDDKKSLQNKFLNKIKIINFDNLIKLSSYQLVDNLVIAMPSINLERKAQILKNLKKIKCNIITLPSQDNITNNKVNNSDLKKINFSDFFGRKINNQNIQNLKKLVHKNILITGGAGSIGSELCFQVLKTKFKKLIIYDQNENNVFYLKLKLKKFIKGNNLEFIVGDINNTSKLKALIKKKKIDKVFHTAAYKHVELSENNIHECIYNNIFGTISVINSLNKSVKNFTMISTDKAAAPTSVMGFSKRITEIIIQNLFLTKKLKNTNLSIVRFGNVFGSDGSAIRVFEKQLREGNPLTITNKRATRYFMTIEEACTLVLNSSSMNSKKGIYVLEMGKPIKIISLANELIKFFNIDKNTVKIKITGLKKGEKLNEILSISKNKFKTKFSNIYEYLEPKYSNNKVMNLIKKLKNSMIYTNEKKTVLIIKKFLNKEIR